MSVQFIERFVGAHSAAVVAVHAFGSVGALRALWNPAGQKSRIATETLRTFSVRALLSDATLVEGNFVLSAVFDLSFQSESFVPRHKLVDYEKHRYRD